VSKAPWVVAGLVVGYFAFTALVFKLFNWGVPAAVEQVLSAVVAPAVLLLALWTPLLKRLGWAQGEWFSVPSPPGFLLLVLVYAALGFGATVLLCRMLSR
jgi:hypothetical protein